MVGEGIGMGSLSVESLLRELGVAALLSMGLTVCLALLTLR